MSEVNIVFALLLGVMLGLILSRMVASLMRRPRMRRKHETSSADPPSASPCETCLRWDECNGEDDTCPLLKENT